MKITFVYNANSGKVNTWMDIGHKLISPDTYSCNLCSITHGIFTERDEWKKYREECNIDLEFLHKNEFEEKYKDADYEYPIILKSAGGDQFEVLVTTEEINKLDSIEELIKLLPTI